MTDAWRIVMVDPGHQVPDYDRALTGALAGHGHQVSLAVSPLLYFEPGPPADGVALETAFGRLLGRGGRRSSHLAQRALARRTLRLASYPVELAVFVRRLVARPPHVLHVQWSLVPPLEAWAWRQARAAGIPVVLTAHNVLPHEARPWHRAAYRALYRAVDGVIVHSNATRARLADVAGLPERHVAVIPMAADTRQGPLPDRQSARRTLGLPLAAPLVLFFGHVRPYKGLDLLLAALPTVRAAVPAARLLVAGPIAGGQAAVTALRRQLGAAGLEGAVDLRPGHVPAALVDSVFAAADVVALPYGDTDDSAVLEAARGRGRAVVATAVGGLPEALAAGGGLVVPPQDVQALAGALVLILADAHTRRRLEADAEARARARTWSDVARETTEAYRAFAGEAGAFVDDLAAVAAEAEPSPGNGPSITLDADPLPGNVASATDVTPASDVTSAANGTAPSTGDGPR